MLRPDQRVFAIASHDLPETQCKSFITDIFGTTNVGELKYTSLRRRPNHQARIIELLRSVRDAGAVTKTYVVDKRFSLCQRMFDYFTESVLHEHGINIFQGAANIIVTNHLYLDLVEALDDNSLGLILSKFEDMMRNRSEAAFYEFWSMLEGAREHSPEQAYPALDALLIGQKFPVSRYLELPNDALDLSFTVMFALMCHWQNSGLERFEVIHDESKNAETYQNVWKQLCSPEIQNLLAGVGDFRSVMLPFRVDDLQFAKSESFAGLQVADCIAGAISEVTRLQIGAPCNEDFAAKLIEAGFDEVTNNILPDRNWSPPKGTMDQTIQDPYEALIDIVGSIYPH